MKLYVVYMQPKPENVASGLESTIIVGAFSTEEKAKKALEKSYITHESGWSDDTVTEGTTLYDRFISETILDK